MRHLRWQGFRVVHSVLLVVLRRHAPLALGRARVPPVVDGVDPPLYCGGGIFLNIWALIPTQPRVQQYSITKLAMLHHALAGDHFARTTDSHGISNIGQIGAPV